jgi:Tol biopolymer transport system component
MCGGLCRSGATDQPSAPANREPKRSAPESAPKKPDFARDVHRPPRIELGIEAEPRTPMRPTPSRAASFTIVGLVVGPLAAQTTLRVSVDSAGAQSNGPSLGPGAISASGNHVAFTSNASNLVAGDTNNAADAFVHDRASGVTERASVSSSGVQGNSASTDPRVSSDGRWVTFVSTATNLVSGDTNGRDDVFLRDRQAGVTTRVSVNSGGTQSNNHSTLHAIAANGGFVVFSSFGANLAPSDTNSSEDVFVRDLQAATTTRVSVDSSGLQADSDSTNPAVSADGRYVVFVSDATNLVAGDTNGVRDVFLHDRMTSATTRVSLDGSGTQANAESCPGIHVPSISGDGRFVAFDSDATNLVAGDTNGVGDVFLRDLVAGSTARVSIGPAGTQANGISFYTCVSFDGRFVGFSSFATNLVIGDNNARCDVFVRDVASGTTPRVSVHSTGAEANGHSSPTLPPSISADGRSFGFDSGASNLVPGDTNGQWDVFVHDRYLPPTSYCTPGTTTNGCAASISASAQPDVAHSGTCSITVTGVDGQRTGIVFYGLSALVQPWCSMGGGTSFLCVKPPTQRSAPQSSGGTSGACDGALALDWNAFQLANPSALGNPWSAGAKAFVQGWFRDPASCKTTSLSDALELTYQP